MLPSGSLYRWTAQNTAHGTLFHPPEGKQLAAVYVRERVRPLEPLKLLARQTRQSMAASVRFTATNEVERIETLESEYAARIDMTGTDKNQQLFRYTLGCVFGDDFYDRVDAYFVGESARVDEYRALTSEFILNYRLNLGENRARRFQYTPPPGWQGRARGLLAQWFTYDFPKRPSQIMVAASFPSNRPEGSMMSRVPLVRRLMGFRADEAKVEPFSHAYGLEGQLYHRRGRFTGSYSHLRATDLFTVVLTDKQSVYVARLETDAQWLEADRALLFDLAQSIRPLPRHGIDSKALTWMVVD